jgi:hypothetical protein
MSVNDKKEAVMIYFMILLCQHSSVGAEENHENPKIADLMTEFESATS